MPRAFLFALVVSTTLASSSAPAQQKPESDALPARIALVSAFADGRTLNHLVTEEPGWFWTPKFPRSTRQPPADGSLPVAAIKMTFHRVTLDVSVVVSVLRGERHEREDVVATLQVPPGERVMVNELTALGIVPIELFQADVVTGDIFQPAVTVITTELAISAVELLTAPFRGYRITVENLSPRTVAAFHVKAHRSTAAMTTGRMGRQGRPLMTPAGRYTFDLRLKGGVGVAPPVPFDLIEIDAVLWDDGTLVGIDPSDVLRRSTAEAGQRLQVARVLEVLRAALDDKGQNPLELLARVRADLEALPDADDERLTLTQVNMRETKAFVLGELRRFEQVRSHDPAEDHRWLRETRFRYEQWLRTLPDI